MGGAWNLCRPFRLGNILETHNPVLQAGLSHCGPSALTMDAVFTNYFESIVEGGGEVPDCGKPLGAARAPSNR